MLNSAEGMLLGAFIEVWLHGMYTMTTFKALRCLLGFTGKERGLRRIGLGRLFNIVITLFLYLNCSLNIVFGCVSLVRADIFHKTDNHGYWLNIAQVRNTHY